MHVVFDLDGTIYLGNTLLHGVAETILGLKSNDITYSFFTNNSSISGLGVAGKLGDLGLEVAPEICFSSADLAGSIAEKNGIKSAFVVGHSPLAEALIAAGCTVCNYTQHDFSSTYEAQVEALFVGICRHFDYQYLDSALKLCFEGCKFYATNMDATYPAEDGLHPGAGAIAASIQKASGIAPVVLGKPESHFIEMIRSKLHLDSEEIIIVGDRYETDVLAGKNAGLKTWMVLTGVTKKLPDGQPGGSTLSELLSFLV
jgi:HAD superfamily hydrolase (TIGR01450 family)